VNGHIGVDDVEEAEGMMMSWKRWTSVHMKMPQAKKKTPNKEDIKLHRVGR
jgi:hypothetical protein